MHLICHGHISISAEKSYRVDQMGNSMITLGPLPLFRALELSWASLCISTALTVIGCITSPLAVPRCPRTFLSPSTSRFEVMTSLRSTGYLNQLDSRRSDFTKPLSMSICVRVAPGTGRRKRETRGFQFWQHRKSI